MAISLGIAPIGWTNDDLPQLGGDISLETCLAESRQAGFTGVEKGGRFPTEAAAMRTALGAHGLTLASGWFSGRLLEQTVEEEKKRIRGQLDLFLAMGCPAIVYAETTATVQGQIDTPVDERIRLAPATIERYGAKLTRLATWLKAEGCPMTFHHHMGTVIEVEDEVDLLMRSSGPEVGLLLDTGHLTFAGGDVAATTRRWGERINHVHVKNIRPKVLERLEAERWSFLKGVLEGVFTVPGDPEGCIDFRAFVKVLKEIGYAGWIIVEAEQDPKKANPLEYARMGYLELTAALEGAGLELKA
jgi:inosose dehydratase